MRIFSGVFSLLISLCWSSSHAQSLEVSKISKLPAGLDECSGMAFIAPNAIAMINDSGNAPELFICDTLGELILQVQLIGLANRDWESLAFADGLLYIGDFGNNNNARKNLKIWVVDVSRLLKEKKWKLVRTLSFSYEDQYAFPPEEKDWYYDLEAMVTQGDSIFLFTKNRTKPFNGIVKVYGLSKLVTQQKAKLVKQFQTDQGLMLFNWVSGASLGPNKDDLFLLGYNRVWYLSNWRQNKDPKLQSYKLGYFSQKEALAVQGNSLYLSEENTKGVKPKLRKVDISLFSIEQDEKDDPYPISIAERSINRSDSLKIKFAEPSLFIGAAWKIYNISGSVVKEGILGKKELNQEIWWLSLKEIPAGRYVLNIDTKVRPNSFIINLL
jgi:hypothetical protein